MVSAIAYISLLASLCAKVSSHGYLSQPEAGYYDSTTKTSYITRVNANEMFPNYRWDYSPEENAAGYEHLVQTGGITQPLKIFMDAYITQCPINDLSNTVDVSSYTTVNWQNDQAREGFVSSHRGPCEVWIDNNMMFSDLDCAKHYTTYPAELPVDYTICQGKCLLSFYWMALHESFWQLYKGCAVIYNSKPLSNNLNYTSATVAPACISPSTSAPVDNSSSINQITYNYINDGGLSLDSQGVSIENNIISLSMSKASPRIYMLDNTSSKYQLFDLNNKKIEFDVDITNIPCNYNLALYFSEMNVNSSIGSGYCDAQGFYAAPCGEMDIFEANTVAQQVTSHPCSGGSCDKSGAPAKLLFANSGLGTQLHVSTSFTTVNGILSDITQVITDKNNDNSKTMTIQDTGAYGGFASMGNSFTNGMVLVISLWTGDMSWLNGECSYYETDGSKVFGSFSNIQINNL